MYRYIPKRDGKRVKINNKINVFKCINCEFTDTDKRRIIKHKQSHKLYKCPECDYTVNHFKIFDRHRRDNHDAIRTKVEYGWVDQYCCDDCNYVTNHKSRFICHRIVHNGHKPLICNVCCKGFAQNIAFNSTHRHTG